MTPLRRLATMTLAFSILAGLGLAFSHLALTDIWHGETDVHLEWLIVRGTGLLVAILLCLAIWLSVTVWRAANR